MSLLPLQRGLDEIQNLSGRSSHEKRLARILRDFDAVDRIAMI